MILATSILFFALFSPVELFKFHNKAPEGPIGDLQAQRQYQSGLYLGAPRYYPLPADFFQAPLQQQQQHLFQQPQFEQQQQQQLPLNEPQLHQATKGGELKATKGLEQRPQLTQESYLPQVPYVQPQPASIAYLVVRPIQPAPLLPPSIVQPQLPAAQVFRAPFRQEETPGIKGGRQTDLQAEQPIQQIEQQREIIDQQPLQPALVVPVPPGKEGKFKTLLDRLMSKLTLGSSYQVTHEEIVQSPVQRQPAAQVQQQISIEQQPIEQQQQQKVEQLEDQRLEQQLEQQRDNFFDEGLKQTKGHQEQQFQVQQQVREEQLQQQSLAEQEQQKPRDQLAFKGQQQPLQQEPIRQELEPTRQEPIKGKRLLPDRLAGQQQIQQESLRQEAKGNTGF